MISEKENDLYQRARRLDDRSVELIQRSRAPGLKTSDLEQIVAELRDVNAGLIDINKEIKELEKLEEAERLKATADEERIAAQLETLLTDNMVLRSGDQEDIDRIIKKTAKTGSKTERPQHKKVRRV